MTVLDVGGKPQGDGCKGNWVDLTEGSPNPHTFKTATLRPNREVFGLELMAKFTWQDEAWLAGERSARLAPGVYRVQASISDGKRKPTTFQWEVTNPGSGENLQLKDLAPLLPFAAGPTASGSASSIFGAAQVSTWAPTPGTVPVQGSSHAGTAPAPPATSGDLARMAAGLPTESQEAAEQATKKRDLATARELQAEGKKLHEELWVHADAGKQQSAGVFMPALIPGSYLVESEDWCNRFRTLPERYLDRKALALNTEPYPVWKGAIGVLAMSVGSPALVEKMDKMFGANLRVLDQIERRLS
jgi:hypothetical protein